MSRAIAAVASTLALAGTASADTYQWDWHRGDAGTYIMNDTAGAWDSVHATFDTQTQVLHWSTTFSNTLTNGLTLALDNGSNPKGHGGAYSLLYVDARDLEAIRMTAYGYNGLNSFTSFKDGTGLLPGDQTPDRIHSSFDSSWIIDVAGQDVGGKRTISFTIDASTINAHAPLYSSLADAWSGAGFDGSLGMWFHSFGGLDATYNAQGWLSRWNHTKQGWLDGYGFDTRNLVPLPTPLGLTLAGLAGLGFARGAARKRA